MNVVHILHLHTIANHLNVIRSPCSTEWKSIHLGGEQFEMVGVISAIYFVLLVCAFFPSIFFIAILINMQQRQHLACGSTTSNTCAWHIIVLRFEMEKISCNISVNYLSLVSIPQIYTHTHNIHFYWYHIHSNTSLLCCFE